MSGKMLWEMFVKKASLHRVQWNGCRSLPASTINDSVRLWKIWACLPVITDKVMPKLDGIAFFKSIKAIPETRGIPVILISGQMSVDEQAAAFDLGLFDFIPKPINDVTLLMRVKRAFWFHDHSYRMF